jgi:hypothetical protein
MRNSAGANARQAGISAGSALAFPGWASGEGLREILVAPALDEVRGASIASG